MWSDYPQGKRLGAGFFTRDVLQVAPELPGKILVVGSGTRPDRFMITEVEAYLGGEDLACHASKGKTARTEIMFEEGGLVYMYLIYGIYWMLNFVTGGKDEPQAVLIRGLKEVEGPGRLTRDLGIDGSFLGESLLTGSRMWAEDAGFKPEVLSGPRIGIDYAGEPWVSIPWRFYSGKSV